MIREVFQMILYTYLCLFILLYGVVAWKQVSNLQILSQLKKTLFLSASDDVKNDILAQKLKVSDLQLLSIREALGAICGPDTSCRDLYRSKGLLFSDVSIERNPPSVGRFLIANPKSFFQKTILAKSHGLDVTSIPPTSSLESLSYQLPVVYIADIHPEYGTLGFMLHRESVNTSMSALFPSLRTFRSRPIYAGGVREAGSSFTMLHRKVGFPENRQFRSPPGEPGKKLFFSPDVAMANELCLTGDAQPNEFKFMQWATIWPPKQLQNEYEEKLWINLRAPLDVLFEDNQLSKPIWSRLVLSLPPESVVFPTSSSSSPSSSSPPPGD